MNKDKQTTPDENVLEGDNQEQTLANEESNSAEGAETQNNNPDEVADQTWAQKVQEANDKYIRLYSEFDNFRRRTARERIELIGTANSELLQALLPVLDDFERAMNALHATESQDPAVGGISLVHHKFQNILEQKGLKAFNSKEEAFDPDFHEAVTKIPAPTPELKGKVVDELEKGYMLGEKVLRYAKVVVGE